MGLPSSGSAGVDLPRRKKGKKMDESKCLDKLVKMGFDRDAACKALANNQGDVTKAVLALVAAEKGGLKKPAETSSEKPEAASKSKAEKPKTVKPASSKKPKTDATSNKKPEHMEVDEPKAVNTSAVKPASSEKPEAKKSKAEKPQSSEAPREPPSKRSKKTPEEDDEEVVDAVQELSKMLDEVRANKDTKEKKEKRKPRKRRITRKPRIRRRRRKPLRRRMKRKPRRRRRKRKPLRRRRKRKPRRRRRKVKPRRRRAQQTMMLLLWRPLPHVRESPLRVQRRRRNLIFATSTRSRWPSFSTLTHTRLVMIRPGPKFGMSWNAKQRLQASRWRVPRPKAQSAKTRLWWPHLQLRKPPLPLRPQAQTMQARPLPK